MRTDKSKPYLALTLSVFLLLLLVGQTPTFFDTFDSGEATPEPITEPVITEPEITLAPETLPVMAAPPFPAEEESWQMPLTGDILRTQGFSYDGNHDDYRYHRGMDIAAEADTPVRAAADGIISESHEDAYWGGTVVITHSNNFETVYQGIKILHGPETPVEQGEIIGHVISLAPGESVLGPHLHFEILENGESLDPAGFFTDAMGE